MEKKRIGRFILNKIYLGDCIKLARYLPDNSIDVVITSPPYANKVSYGNNVDIVSPENYVEWILPLFHEAKRFLKETGSFILNINDKATNGTRSIYVFELVVRIVKETGLQLFDRYVWCKKSSLPTPGDKRLNDRIEYIFHFVKNPKKFKCYTDRIRMPYKEISLRRFKNKTHGNDIINLDGTTQLSQRGRSEPHPKGTKHTTVFEFNTGSALRGNKHPAPFHPDLPEFFVIWLTNKGNIILDPFMGSGTVAKVAKEMGRNYLGFEINPSYKFV